MQVFVSTAVYCSGGLPSRAIFSRRTNQTQEVWVYSHDGPIKRIKVSKRGIEEVRTAVVSGSQV
eukprot:9492155-Pyramimonas_sp.AAC.2